MWCSAPSQSVFLEASRCSGMKTCVMPGTSLAGVCLRKKSLCLHIKKWQHSLYCSGWAVPTSFQRERGTTMPQIRHGCGGWQQCRCRLVCITGTHGCKTQWCRLGGLALFWSLLLLTLYFQYLLESRFHAPPSVEVSTVSLGKTLNAVIASTYIKTTSNSLSF